MHCDIEVDFALATAVRNFTSVKSSSIVFKVEPLSSPHLFHCRPWAENSSLSKFLWYPVQKCLGLDECNL